MTPAAPGPLAEETVRLVEAITDWARGSAGAGAGTTPGEAGASSGAAPECGVCPICALLSVVRRTQPEIFAHLAEASASMVAALRTLVERHDHDHPGDGGAGRPAGPAAGVERIDLDDSGDAADAGAMPSGGGWR